MTDDELDRINQARRRKSLPPLSGSQASSAAASAPNRHDAEFDSNWFLINLIMSSADEPKTNPASDPSPQLTADSGSSSSATCTPDMGSSSYSDSESNSSSSDSSGSSSSNSSDY